MEHGFFLGVIEEGWAELEPSVMRPSRPGLARTLGVALGIPEADAARAIAFDRMSDTERLAFYKRLDVGLDADAMRAASKKRREDIAALLARAPAAAETWPMVAPAAWLANTHRLMKTGLIPRTAEAPLTTSWTSWTTGRAPATPEYVAALAADPATIELVERHALEAGRRLAPWRTIEPEGVIWSIEHEPRAFDYERLVPFRNRFDEALGVRAERLAFGERLTDIPRNPPRDEWRFEWLRRAKRDLTRSNVWLEAGKDPDANPFAPLIAIWSLGYAVSAIIDDGIVITGELPKLEEIVGVLF